MTIEIANYETAQFIIAQVGGELGLTVPTTDPYQSSDPSIKRLCTILRGAGKQLLGMHEWQSQEVVFTLNTKLGDSGVYPLPADFTALTDQTGWQLNYFWPLRGPYSAQMWQRIINFPTTGIYVAFRIQNNQLWLWPQPPPVGITISFVYKSSYWTEDGVTGDLKAFPTQGVDVINFDWLMMSAFLKVRYLQEIGHDTTSAMDNFKMIFDMMAGQSDGAAPELHLARSYTYPYLNIYNIPDTGFGSA
jgi:hypothetical protein